MKVSIELTANEIVNLFQALKILPENGDWKINITLKVFDAMDKLGWTKEELENNFHPNSGMCIKSLRRHIDILELKSRN